MRADIRCSTATLTSWSGEALAVGLFSGDAGEASRGPLLERFGAAVAERLEQRRFKAKPGDCLSIDRLGQTPSLLVLVGLGAPADFGPEQLRSAAAAASKAAAAAGASQLAMAMPVEGMAPAAAATAMAEAVRLGLYADQRFKSEAEPSPTLTQVELLGLAEPAQSAVVSASAVCSGVE
ncbi:MAG: M17 family peptidase N-terminal domain-containing protein, partial [Vulcanococcus sp.]